MAKIRLLPFLLVFGFAAIPSDAFAFCPGDGWSSTFATITPWGAGQMLMEAFGNMSHSGSHSTCFGDIRAKALHTTNSSCNSGWSATQHLPGEGNENVYAGVVCNVPCGYYQYAGGELNWNGATDERFPESSGLRQVCDCEPPPGGCPIEGCIWSYYECDCVDCCPLVFDTTGRGYKLTSADLGVWFDINADGQQDQISWTDPTKDVAFLAFDRNGNQVIDDGEELFGNATPLPGGQPGTERHGFDALASLELPEHGPSIADGVIDSRDTAYAKLLLWKDANHDGRSQPRELRRASDAGLVAIETRYRESKRTDEFGNEYRLRGISWWQRPRGLDARFFYDVWFVPTRPTQ